MSAADATTVWLLPHRPSQFKDKYFAEMCSGSEAGSYLRLIDSCIPQLKAQGPSRTSNESKEEEEEDTNQFRWLHLSPSMTTPFFGSSRITMLAALSDSRSDTTCKPVVLNLRTTTSQKCEAVLRRART